jgi:membrane protein YqaA with SNARE-associated domain
MKFNFTWQQVAVLALLLAAIPITYALVAPAAGVVTGMVNVILGSLFVDLKKKDSALSDGAEGGSK